MLRRIRVIYIMMLRKVCNSSTLLMKLFMICCNYSLHHTSCIVRGRAQVSTDINSLSADSQKNNNIKNSLKHGIVSAVLNFYGVTKQNHSAISTLFLLLHCLPCLHSFNIRKVVVFVFVFVFVFFFLGGGTQNKRPNGDVPPTWVIKSNSWYMNDPV